MIILGQFGDTVDDRGKISGSIKFYYVESVIIGSQDAFDAVTVWIRCHEIQREIVTNATIRWNPSTKTKSRNLFVTVVVLQL